jgi:hypothetical protein
MGNVGVAVAVYMIAPTDFEECVRVFVGTELLLHCDDGGAAEFIPFRHNSDILTQRIS